MKPSTATRLTKIGCPQTRHGINKANTAHEGTADNRQWYQEDVGAS